MMAREPEDKYYNKNLLWLENMGPQLNTWRVMQCCTGLSKIYKKSSNFEDAD